MVQTISSITLLGGEKRIMIKKPLSLHRIFFSIQAFADQNTWLETKISFDDPQFRSFYVIDGPVRYFEAEGDDIFQGNVWIFNTSGINLLYSATEILR